jgi:hypothetical protein
MNAYLNSENFEAIFERPRRRHSELYFNGLCLLRVLLNGNWPRAPFFLRNLWRALAE